MQLLSSFFESHKSFLSKKYPGINLSRLENELNYFLGTNFNYSISQTESFLECLSRGLPLEQINHSAYFYRSQFYINENVLIPRSETEILVEKSIDYINTHFRDAVSVCDVGTGTGAIILSVISEIETRNIKACASDISEKALEVARINYFRSRLERRENFELSFSLSDRLESIEENFDVILSNPPYIKEDTDRSKVHGQVHEYEPHLALYLKDVEYDSWFDELFSQVDNSLNMGGLFLMEGHEDHLQYLREAFIKSVKQINYNNIELIEDYTGRTRFLWATKKKS